MAQYTSIFLELIDAYKTYEAEFPNLKAVTVAQWILETGRGASELAQKHNNFGGMKWRKAMAPYAAKRLVKVSDGSHFYCSFNSLQDFLEGYWAWMEREPYKGWRQHADDDEAFLSFIGPIWAEDANYVEKVLDLLPEAEELLGASEKSPVSPADCCTPMGTPTDVGKPTIDRFESTTHQSSRNGTDIDTIIVHYTTSRNIEGTINWFKTAPQGERVSAHYIVGQDGELVQMVNDSDAAWHAGSVNKQSIGIEHVAAPGDAMTPQQMAKSVALIRWLIREYEIKRSRVLPHKCVSSTNCYGDLLTAYGATRHSDCATQTQAISDWLADHGL